MEAAPVCHCGEAIEQMFNQNDIDQFFDNAMSFISIVNQTLNIHQLLHHLHKNLPAQYPGKSVDTRLACREIDQMDVPDSTGATSVELPYIFDFVEMTQTAQHSNQTLDREIYQRIARILKDIVGLIGGCDAFSKFAVVGVASEIRVGRFVPENGNSTLIGDPKGKSPASSTLFKTDACGHKPGMFVVYTIKLLQGN